MPLDELVASLDQELWTEVRNAIAPIAHQRLYVLALAIGRRATSLYVTANTEEHLQATVPAGGDLTDPYWRWDCSGDWAVIAPRSLPSTNSFLAELGRSHEAWLWSFAAEERFERSMQTWAELRSRLVGVFHDALLNLVGQRVIGHADDPPCICLLDLGDPEFTKWSAKQLSNPTSYNREFGST